MLEPSTNQPNEQIAQLQAELTESRQENTELQSLLEAYRLEPRAQSADDLQPIAAQALGAAADAALRQTLDLLAVETNIERFLGHVLKVIADQLNAPLTEYWFHPEPNNIAYVGLTYWQGQTLIPEQQPKHPGVIGFPVLPELVGQEGLHHRLRHFVVEDLTTDVRYLKVKAEYGIDAGAWYERYGVTRHLNVPLILGDKTIGALIVFLPSDRHFTKQQIELAYALAQQVTLAIQLTRLAEAAKQAVSAREQEQAASERAAELAKVNEVLRQRGHEVQRSYRILEATAQATDTLLTIRDFDRAVNTALQILGESLETDRTKVLESLFDDPTRPFSRYHNVLYEWTSPGTVQQRSHPQSWQVDTRGRMEDFFETFLQKNGFGGLLAEWDASLHAAFRTLEVKSLYVVPIWVDQQWWGILAFDDCREAKQRTQAEMAVLQTVANCIGSVIQRQRTQQVIFEAEQERAAELAKANEALQAEVVERHQAERLVRGQAEALVRILAAFAAAPVLDNFLGIVLQAIVEQLGDHAGSIWLYDETQNITWLHLDYEAGQIQPGSQITRPSNDPILLRQWNTDFLQVLRQQKILLQDLRQFAALPAYAAYHADNQQFGIKMNLVVALFFGETLLGSVTLRGTAYRKYKPEELELIQALAHQAALAIQLTRLAEQSKQAAISEERNRIAREIHDTLAQSFTSIRMQLEAALRFLDRKPEQATACITFAQELAKSGLAEARRSVWTLQPDAEDYRHLSTTLQRLAAQQTAETSIQVEVAIVGTPYALPPDVGMNLLRIGQEALNNAIRHASAQTLLTLTYAPSQIQLQIQDNGQGFDPQQLSSGGFGLIGMQQRSERLGGTFTISSQPGYGTEIQVTVPILEDRGSESTPIN